MIRSVDDRMTWVCTGAPPTARLRLAALPSSRAILDGAWWPGSRDPVVELCGLVIALTGQRGAVIERIMLQPAAWDRHPRRLGVGGAVVRVGWFSTLDRALVIATGPQNLRIDLAVIPPETPRAEAMAVMLAASHPANTRRAGDILSVSPYARSRRQGPQIDAEAVWETEGGHLQPDRRPTAAARS
jgi:hypothetical protein